MQDKKNDLQNSPLIKNGEDSHLQLEKTPIRKRFIECLRCGKLIKNNLRTIKKHEYYCSHRKLAVENEVIKDQELEPEDQDFESDIEQYMEQESDQDQEEESLNLTNVFKTIFSVVAIAAFLVAVFKVVNVIKINPKSITNQSDINKQAVSSQIPQQPAPPLPYSLPTY